MKRFNLVILSLAVTDLLCGFLIPFDTLRKHRWSALGEQFCKVYTTLVVMGLSSSIYHFVFVNFERLMALKLPLDRRSPNGHQKIKFGIACCWLMSVLPALPMWLSKSSTIHTTSSTTNSTNITSTTFTDNCTESCHFPVANRSWVWCSSLLVFIIPTIVILTIWLIMASHYRPGGSHLAQAERKARRITVVMTTITLAFLICWWPYVIVFTLGSLGWFVGGSLANHSKLLMNLVIVAYFNGLINPILYILINRDVRSRIKAACQSNEN